MRAIAMLRMLWLRVSRKAERSGSSVMMLLSGGSERKRVEQGLQNQVSSCFVFLDELRRKKLGVSRRLKTHADHGL
jgi:hypothetical protein